MTNLKTLKDLEVGIHVGNLQEVFNENRKVGSEWTTSIILAGDLKAEAIKWVKNGNADENNEPIDWIKHFFNLTEDELSQEKKGSEDLK